MAAVVEAIGVVLLLYGLLGDPGAAGATATVLGFGDAADDLRLRAAGADAGAPAERPDRPPAGPLPGPHGPLARENARRQPQRTAVTASALMIGVALVVLVAIFAAGLRATIDQGIDEQVKAVGIVTHEDDFSPLAEGIPAADREGRRRDRRLARSASPPAASSARPATRR